MTSQARIADKFLVSVLWDDEASVWVATSDDIPGLVTEAPSLDELMQRVQAVAPELIRDNGRLMSKRQRASELIDMHIVSKLPRGDNYAR